MDTAFVRKVVGEGDVQAIVEKAQEKLRQTRQRIRAGSQAIRKFEHCRNGVALELACRDLGVEVSQRKVAEVCGAKFQQYVSLLRHAERVMPGSGGGPIVVSRVVDVGYVATMLLGAGPVAGRITADAQRVLQARTDRLARQNRPSTYDNAVVAAAIFECASRRTDADRKELRRELLGHTGVTNAAFTRARDDLVQTRIVDDVIGGDDDDGNHHQQQRRSSSQKENKSKDHDRGRRPVASLRAQQLAKKALDAHNVVQQRRDLPPIPEDAPPRANLDDDVPEEENVEPPPPYEDWALATFRRAFPDREPPSIVSLASIERAFDDIIQHDRDDDDEVHEDDDDYLADYLNLSKKRHRLSVC